MKMIIWLFPLLVSCQHFSQQMNGQSYFENTWQAAQEQQRQQNTEASEGLFKEIYLLGIDSSPQYSTLSLFELAQINESKGNWELALSQLKECETKKSFLPSVKADLELPSRIAGAYAALGEVELSNIYSKKAEQALQVYSSQLRPDLRADWWAETYFRMGSIPIQGMTEQNWLAYAKRFESSLTHLIRSMEYSDPNWSLKSLLQAEDFFKKSLEFSSLDQELSEDNWWIKQQSIREKLDTMIFLIQKVKIWKFNQNQPSQWISQFYKKIDIIESEVLKRRSKFQDTAPLTPENLRRKKIKREDLEVLL